MQKVFSFLFPCKRLFARYRYHSGALPLYRKKLLRLWGARFREKDYEGSHQETNAQNESRESEQLHIRGVRHLGVDSHTVAVARAHFVQRARTRTHYRASRAHVRTYTYTDRVQERAGYRSWRDEATTSWRLVLDVLTPRELTPSVSS